MKKDRGILENEISVLSTKYGMKKNIINYMVDFLYYEDEKMDEGRIIGIINKSIPIFQATEYELYCLAIGFNKAINEILGLESAIDLHKYFTEYELTEYKLGKIEIIDNEDYFTVVFHNVDQITENHYICTKETYHNIADLVNHGILTYNFATQRQATRRVFNGNIIKEPTINKRSVREISRDMAGGMFHSNPISLNIRRITGRENFQYVPEDRSLIIKVDNKMTFLDIIDGMHRALGMVGAVQKNPITQKTSMINIFHYSEDEARQFIIQESKRNVIKPEHLKMLNVRDEWVIMTKDIDSYGSNMTNVLFNKIAEDKTDKRVEGKYITLSLFSDALKINFRKYYDKPFDLVKIKKFVVEGMGALIGMYEEYSTDAERQVNIYEEGMIIGWLAILSEIFPHEDWMDRLDIIVSYICKQDDNSNEEMKNAYEKIGVHNQKKTFKTTNLISRGFKEIYKKIIHENV